MKAYYNEIDEYAAQWLRNLIAAGHITPGDVDTRSIEDVTPADLIGYDRCHFFAGIGVWDYALNRAGWGTGEVWTGSCPCQPFSVAGKGDGFADERHLWPAFHYLIEQRRPVAVFGEQVASKDGYAWLDLVQADLEGTGYTVGAVVAPAAGFGAPHQRHRMYWVADTAGEQCPRALQKQSREPVISGERIAVGGCGNAGGMADTDGSGHRRGELGNETDTKRPPLGGREDERGRGHDVTHGSANGGMADSATERRQHVKTVARSDGEMVEQGEPRFGTSGGGNAGGMAYAGNERRDGEYPLLQRQESGRFEKDSVEIAGNSATRGFWSAAGWIYCRDEKYRPVEPGTFPLAHGATARVGRLRAYGNAINAPQAEEFIKAYLETRP